MIKNAILVTFITGMIWFVLWLFSCLISLEAILKNGLLGSLFFLEILAVGSNKFQLYRWNFRAIVFLKKERQFKILKFTP